MYYLVIWKYHNDEYYLLLDEIIKDNDVMLMKIKNIPFAFEGFDFEIGTSVRL